MRDRGRRRVVERTYLHLQMAPLSEGALQPVRQLSRSGTAIVVVTVLAAVFVFVAPLMVFFSTFGDPYGRGFVERRADGLYAQLRSCGDDLIHTIEVSRFDESAPDRFEPFWSATSSVSGGTPAVRLFEDQARVETHRAGRERVPDQYVVLINRGRESEAQVTVTPASIAMGQVEFGGGPPVPTASYLAMPDSDFGCA